MQEFEFEVLYSYFLCDLVGVFGFGLFACLRQ